METTNSGTCVDIHDLALLDDKQVTALTSLGPAERRKRAKIGTFPTPKYLGFRCVRWQAGEIRAWLEQVAKAPPDADLVKRLSERSRRGGIATKENRRIKHEAAGAAEQQVTDGAAAS